MTKNKKWQVALLAVVAGVTAAGCLPDSQEPRTRAPAEQGPNIAPTISGTPAASAVAGSQYRFRPTARDPDGDTLTWSITGKPPDATFNVTTGEFTWTPTATGTWTGIVITVTDSANASASLPPFSISVVAQQLGSASLSWDHPARYTDGSVLPPSELAAFRIYHGASAGTLSRLAEVDSITSTFTVQNLDPGTHYFAVTAVSSGGAESAYSAIGSKTIR